MCYVFFFFYHVLMRYDHMVVVLYNDMWYTGK